MDKPHVPEAQMIYGRIVYWLTIASCTICTIGPLVSLFWPNHNLINPYFVFARIFEGSTPREIWQATGREFPGGHFFLSYPLTGDGLTQLGLAAIGCSSAAWALMAATFSYVRSHDRLFAAMSLFVSILILLAMSGIISLSE